MIAVKTIFAQDVENGLLSSSKSIPSMYFYDQKGEALFREIMNLEEYYLTDAELEILTKQGNKIAELISQDGIEIVELGAGDGIKTKEFLKHFDHPSNVFRPIDISEDAIRDITTKMKSWIPYLKTEGICGDYFQMLEGLKGSGRKLILFLGSNLGNMLDDQAKVFLKSLDKAMNSGDQLLLGLDLIKPKEIVLPAYKDEKGITSAFNMNLLERMNSELGADFAIEKFEHVAEYETEEGIARSFIQSNEEQSVFVEELDCTIDFKQGEKIQTEVSRKYNEEILRGLLENTSLKIQELFTDEKGYFTDFLILKE
jgi:L-histidine N-alpha-methyltransferase